MAFTQTPSVSEILRSKHEDKLEVDGEGSSKTKSRDDWRKQKELEEARKVSSKIEVFNKLTNMDSRRIFEFDLTCDLSVNLIRLVQLPPQWTKKVVTSTLTSLNTSPPPLGTTAPAARPSSTSGSNPTKRKSSPH